MKGIHLNFKDGKLHSISTEPIQEFFDYTVKLTEVDARWLVSVLKKELGSRR